MSISIDILPERLQEGEWIPIFNIETWRFDRDCKKRKENISLKRVEIGPVDEMFAVLGGVCQDRFLREHRVLVKPISQPRGLPKNLSPHLKSYFTEEYFSGHSWYLVQELIDFEWTKHVLTMCGCIDRKLSHLFSGYSPFPHEVLSPESEPFQLILEYSKPNTVEVSWVETYQEFICRRYADMYDYFIETLQSLGSPREVRIIFAFR